MIDDTFRILVPVVMWLTVVVGLIGNSLVVYVVVRNKDMRSMTNVLIANLAIADFLFIIFWVVFLAWDLQTPYYPFGDAWCSVSTYLGIVLTCVSIYTLVMMSVVRFLAVVYPLSSISIRTKRNSYIAIGILWVVLLLACTPALYMYGEVSYGEGVSACEFKAKEYDQASVQISFFLGAFVVPLGATLCLYVLLLRRLWFGAAELIDHVPAERLRSMKRVTRLVIVVMIVFAVCWFPLHIVALLRSMDAYELDPTMIAIMITAMLLATLNSCVNPILYAFLSENFRKAFKEAIVCRSRRGDPDTAAAGSCATVTSKISVTSLPPNID